MGLFWPFFRLWRIKNHTAALMIVRPASAPMTIPAMAPPFMDEGEEGTGDVVGEGVTDVVGTGVVVDDVVLLVVLDVVCVAAMRVWGSKDHELALGLAEESDE